MVWTVTKAGTLYFLAREVAHYRGDEPVYSMVSTGHETEEEAWQDVQGDWPAEWNLTVLKVETSVVKEDPDAAAREAGEKYGLEYKGTRTHKGVTGTVWGPKGQEFPWRPRPEDDPAHKSAE